MKAEYVLPIDGKAGITFIENWATISMGEMKDRVSGWSWIRVVEDSARRVGLRSAEHGLVMTIQPGVTRGGREREFIDPHLRGVDE